MEKVTCDVLVVGSGAGGLAAAITARNHGMDVLVVEKASVIGGTTAISGGYLWIPGHGLSSEQERETDRAYTYLQGEAGNHFDAARVQAFLENGPKMVDFFMRSTAVAFESAPAFPDYHPEKLGGVAGGRSILASSFDGRELGADLPRLRPPLPQLTLAGMAVNSRTELPRFLNANKSPRDAFFVVWKLLNHWQERIRYGRGIRMHNGQALAARLFRTALDLGIPIWTDTTLIDLIKPDARVEGAVLMTRQASRSVRIEVSARRGVVLATGGFAQGTARRAELFGQLNAGTEHQSPVSETNAGDGLAAAERAGCAIETSLPHAAAWVPVSTLPARMGAPTRVFPHFFDRAKPGVIAINAEGCRFVNEASSYHDFGAAMLANANERGIASPGAYLICDYRTLRQYGLGAVRPNPLPYRTFVRTGYLKQAFNLEALAEILKVSPSALTAQVQLYNESVSRGKDDQFGKGTSAYDRYLGDPRVSPNPCLAAVCTPPFFAIKVALGSIGTFAGIVTNAKAQALDNSGSVVEGLYIVGNDMASVMGGGYPGGGITLGPAMTFGYIAGNDLANV